MHLYRTIYDDVGPILIVLITIVGIRLLSYWRSFIFHRERYRHIELVSTDEIRTLPLPFVKIQITTRGSAGSTEVILRGIRNVQDLASEDPKMYRKVLSVELVTESQRQAAHIEQAFAACPIPVTSLIIPAGYETPNGTKLKARGLHFAVEQRRAGWNKKSGKTWIVHYDEESVMVPAELRKLLKVLVATRHQVLEGPIHYPLEYLKTSSLCRSMEANRPIGCFECRHVMESGTPFHLHGSNLVVDEAFENDQGWDFGCLNGEPFVAEDYVFGMVAYLAAGSDTFGWHGCVMLEQPPFSYRSAFRQRYRWILGVLQGLTWVRRSPAFTTLPQRVRARILLGTFYRIMTFALGAVIGVCTLVFAPLFLYRAIYSLATTQPYYLSPWLILWLAGVGALWLGSVFIGAWYNVSEAGLTARQRWEQLALAVAIAPIAGIFESFAGLWALLAWCSGRRTVDWQPTPKTLVAETRERGKADRDLAAV